MRLPILLLLVCSVGCGKSLIQLQAQRAELEEMKEKVSSEVEILSIVADDSTPYAERSEFMDMAEKILSPNPRTRTESLRAGLARKQAELDRLETNLSIVQKQIEKRATN